MSKKYVNPFSDFGFKRIFGEEANKSHLIDFLNSLLPSEHRIAHLEFNNSEQLGVIRTDRKAIFDIYCENEKGEKFIVEMQKSKQDFFRERTIFYSTFPIRDQIEKSDWNFELTAIYCIGILDFVFNDYGPEENTKEVVHTIKLKDQHGKIFYDKLTYIYLEMPNFNKQESELESRLDRWLYFLKNIVRLEDIPEIFKDEVFTSAFRTAEISNMTVVEYEQYVGSMKAYTDMVNVIAYATKEAQLKGFTEGMEDGREKGIEKGMQEGIEKGMQEGIEKGEYRLMSQLAIRLKRNGKTAEEIHELTGFELSVIQKILEDEAIAD